MTVTVYLQDNVANDTDIGSTERVGESCNSTASVFYDLYCTDAQFYLKNPNSNAGTVTCGVFNGTTLLHTFWTLDMSTLSTTTFTLTDVESSPYEDKINVGDYIGCTSSAGAKMGMRLADVFDGSDSTWQRNSTVNTSYDTGFKITIDTAAPSPSPSDASVLLPPNPAMVRL